MAGDQESGGAAGKGPDRAGDSDCDAPQDGEPPGEEVPGNEQPGQEQDEDEESVRWRRLLAKVREANAQSGKWPR